MVGRTSLRRAIRPKSMLGDALVENPVVMHETRTLKEAIDAMLQLRSQVVVIVSGSRVVGTLAETDALRAISSSGLGTAEIRLGDAMRPLTEAASFDDEFEKICGEMLCEDLRALPVMTGDRFEGVVTLRSLLNHWSAKSLAETRGALAAIEEDRAFRAQPAEEKVKRLTAEIRRFRNEALIDDLTGLFNARYFRIRMAAEFERAERYKRPLSLVFIDVDNFKAINDNFGHVAGDEILRIVGTVLGASHEVTNIGSAFRGCDLVMRYGGEEFVILMPETDTRGAYIAAERYRIAIASFPFQSDVLPAPLNVTLSLGIASYPGHGTTQEELLKNADGAMYAAKRGGKNRTMIFERTAENSSGSDRASRSIR